MNDGEYYCPLLKKIIDMGLCMDINFEREGKAKLGILKEFEITKSFADLNCCHCPRLPFT
ncbi:hypothetical protein PaecuDRAFT_4467 [Paenibacillus curdlanolyticus YK9]|uniref:Uncharacterized protein n=1 Tax=Paenibacillus curdlanolyticus YK9 TaxID=717606 RepID=E0IFK7_9BACL|nr:hypothetical protein [Paenibacillus curdlanolyticus]EFM08673.1 hypothetical protein PaecuDRAFT_4467 [Paenibacillus curdlanolyticus YK9]